MFVAWIIISFLVGIGVVGSIVGAALALYRGTLDNGGSRPQARRIAIIAGVGLGAWAGCSAALAALGRYERPLPPWPMIAMLAELAGLLIVAQLPAVRRALSGPLALRRLLWPQFVRIVGMAFIVALVAGILPPLFALPAGLGDMAVGVAVFRAHRLTATGRPVRTLVAVNVLGIVDLVTALAIGGLTRYGLIHASPDTSAIGRLPFALILTVGVPLFLACHIISLGHLRQTSRRSAQSSSQRSVVSESRAAM